MRLLVLTATHRLPSRGARFPGAYAQRLPVPAADGAPDVTRTVLGGGLVRGLVRERLTEKRCRCPSWPGACRRCWPGLRLGRDRTGRSPRRGRPATSVASSSV